MKTALYILGLCTVYVPNQPVLTVSLCRMAHDTQQRVIIVADDWTDDKREWLLSRVKYMDRTGCEGRC